MIRSARPRQAEPPPSDSAKLNSVRTGTPDARDNAATLPNGFAAASSSFLFIGFHLFQFDRQSELARSDADRRCLRERMVRFEGSQHVADEGLALVSCPLFHAASVFRLRFGVSLPSILSVACICAMMSIATGLAAGVAASSLDWINSRIFAL